MRFNHQLLLHTKVRVQLLILPKICVSLGQVPRRWTIPRFIMQLQGKQRQQQKHQEQQEGKNKAKRARHLPLSHWRHIQYTSSLSQIPSHVCVRYLPPIKNHISKKAKKTNLPSASNNPPQRRAKNPPPPELHQGIHQNESLHFKIFSRSILCEKNRARQSLFSTPLFNPIHPSLLRKNLSS